MTKPDPSRAAKQWERAMTPQKTTHTRGAKGGMGEMICEERMDIGMEGGEKKIALERAREPADAVCAGL